MKLRARLTTMILVVLTATAGLAVAADKNKGDEPNARSVQGVVTNAADAGVQGAVVYLKNTKNLQIRSFITKEQGAYFFHGLSSDVDYELKAEYQAGTTPTKSLSSFDNRKQAVINLKLNR